MGNICGPKKVSFLPSRSSPDYQITEKDYRYFNFNNNILDDKFSIPISETHVRKSVKKYPDFFDPYNSWDNNLIARTRSNDSNTSDRNDDRSEENNNDLSPDIQSDSSSNCSLSLEISSFLTSNDESKLNQIKSRLRKKFKQLCLEVTSQNSVNVERVRNLLETATRINFATLVDMQNDRGNTAICIAVIRDDLQLLHCLFKFFPDFPPLIKLEENKSVPLVQVAATKSENPNNYNNNILSEILNLWIKFDSYQNVAYRNIFQDNHESKSLFEFLLDEIGNNRQVNIHFTNLEFVFKLFKRFYEYENQDVYQISTFLTDEIFWSSERKAFLVNFLQSKDFIGNYKEVIQLVCKVNVNT